MPPTRTPTGIETHNLGICHGQESNLRPFSAQADTQSTEPPGLGVPTQFSPTSFMSHRPLREVMGVPFTHTEGSSAGGVDVDSCMPIGHPSRPEGLHLGSAPQHVPPVSPVQGLQVHGWRGLWGLALPCLHCSPGTLPFPCCRPSRCRNKTHSV